MRLSNIASKAIGILAIVQGTASANLPELTDNSLAKRADSTSSVVDFVNGKNTGSTPVSFTNGCPCYDFTFHSQTQNTLVYHMDVLSVKWDHDNIYMITIHVYADKQIPISNLWSLKIIGVDSPDGGTFQLYGHNENTYLINNPTDWTATFRINASADPSNPDIQWMPNFQIQYEYCQGSATCDSTWWQTYKGSTFDLITGCNNHDNNQRSQTDFPGYYWFKDHQAHSGVYPSSYDCSKTPSNPPSNPPVDPKPNPP
ncbi:hypothetical protein C6P41_001395, partial [Kluyveromyces marxianus]